MKHSFLLRDFLIVAIVISCFNENVDGQSITGQIFDYETSEPLPYVNIYFNGSYYGTTSDLDGEFALNIGDRGGQEVIISSTGYQSHILKVYNAGEFYKINLKLKSVLLNEVEIILNEMSREKKEKIFLKEFLGRTSNAKKCSIENLADIKLVYMKSSKELLAFSSEPLIIYNKALGYKITYFLDEFKRGRKVFGYHGHSIFEDMTAISEQERKKIKKRRLKAYMGSRMHFFRILWKDEIDKSNFYVRDHITGEKSPMKDYINTDEDGTKYFHIPTTLYVSYLTYDYSFLIPIEDSLVHFTKNGYFDSKGIQFQGRMSIQRMGDLLPFEYSPNGRE